MYYKWITGIYKRTQAGTCLWPVYNINLGFPGNEQKFPEITKTSVEDLERCTDGKSQIIVEENRFKILKMSGYTSLLLKISNELEKSDLKTMKYCCKEYGIGARVLEDISDGLELFKELEKRNLLGPDNKDILLELLEKADRIDLKNKVLGTQGELSNICLQYMLLLILLNVG